VRAILKLNDFWAVTDRKGAFLFPSLQPGKYLLRVESASLGTNRVTALLLPALFEIKKGQTITLDLGAVRAASVTVRVAVAPLSATNTTTNATPTVSQPAGAAPIPGVLVPASPVNAPCEGVIVQLSNDKETLQAYTSTDGRATFDHLRPGPWKCKVRDNNLPAYHYVENPEIKLDLTPGENREVAVRVLARQRTIQFIDSGAVK
jgi:hypothetical protein